MKIRSVLSLVLLFASVLAFSQDQEKSNSVVLELNKQPVYLNEFEAVFKKNNPNPDTSPEALDEYMDLFVNYKLKVAEAEALGMDTVSSFVEELSGYRSQLAAPYLTDQETTEALIKEAYENLKYEVKAGHILVRVSGTAPPEDTLAPYKEIMKIKKQLDEGAEFEFVAAAKSEDPSAKTNQGNLGYFTGMQMVWPFEKAAFSGKVGEIVGPIRTNFGYHLIKIYDRRPSRGKVQVSHILVRYAGDTLLSKQKIDELYTKVKAGEEFAELAKKYSQDSKSANKGGLLDEFGAGRMVDEFETVAFGLENPGDISEPFKSPYGWHIVKLERKIPLAPYEEMRSRIENRIKRDDRSKTTRKAFIEKLKREYNYKRNENEIAKFYKWVDDRVFQGTWEIPKKAGNQYLATWADTGITAKVFAMYIDKLQRKAAKEDIKYFVNVLYSRLENNKILLYENTHLEEKYPEFSALMKEYRDGILLFDLMNQKVWNKAIQDTTGLKQYFEQHRDDFVWKQRAEVTIYKSENKSLLKKVAKKLNKGWSEEKLLSTYSEENKLDLTTEELIEEKGDSDLLDLFAWEKGVSPIKEHNDRYTLVHFKSFIPAGPKKLEEARGAVIAAYQNQLEKEWLEELRGKYDIKVNKEVLYTVK
ncbi:peptidylprolyl isomerase [Luteibaculum oceani]|uniref:PpiC domain-containing protein n=1 Tax=Luteibaculum oceani TaxID=1294296 RepID=A0A5C6V7X9_9FLAO|nr:peptidylprolyl isomerase [Luteibaculum oceani]TXC81373.1 hypothetical protein FRX97_05045 [Luteibaculum oceani]